MEEGVRDPHFPPASITRPLQRLRDAPRYLWLQAERQEPGNPMGERVSSDTPPPPPGVPGAAGTSRCFATTPVVSKIGIRYFKRFSFLFTEIVTRSRVKICLSLLCSPHLEIPSRI